MSSPLDLSEFTGWVKFADLKAANVPTEPGVYVVIRPTDEPHEFRPDVRYTGDKPFPVAELEQRWVPGERIIYIGRANHGSDQRGLRRRLRQFRRYGAGGSARHSGGRAIWQLADCSDLLVGWRELPDEDVVRTETAMIAAFKAHYGAWPFANGKD
ncbi:hypothetical protein QN239_09000 [Mycolicibacterium sp. Y3]